MHSGNGNGNFDIGTSYSNGFNKITTFSKDFNVNCTNWFNVNGTNLGVQSNSLMKNNLRLKSGKNNDFRYIDKFKKIVINTGSY